MKTLSPAEWCHVAILAGARRRHLLTLKRIATAARSAPGDAEDITFLEARLRTAPST